MPQGPITFYDLLTRGQDDVIAGLVDEVVTNAPEWRVIPATRRPGTSYKLRKRVELPPVQFRDFNSGVKPGKSKWKLELKEMFFLDAHIEADEALVKAENTGLGEIMAEEGQATLQSAAIYMGDQFYYGNAASSKGFQGISTQIGDDTTYVGGTTGTTSAYLIDVSPSTGVGYDVGNDGAFEVSDPIRQRIVSEDGKGNRFAWLSNICGFVGLAVRSEYAVWRVRGIDLAHPLTDEVAAELISKIPSARLGNMRWLMNSRARFTLQKSRSAIGAVASEAGAWAPLPTELQGIPVIATDSLLNTEVTTNS